MKRNAWNISIIFSAQKLLQGTYIRDNGCGIVTDILLQKLSSDNVAQPELYIALSLSFIFSFPIPFTSFHSALQILKNVSKIQTNQTPHKSQAFVPLCKYSPSQATQKASDRQISQCSTNLEELPWQQKPHLSRKKSGQLGWKSRHIYLYTSLCPFHSADLTHRKLRPIQCSVKKQEVQHIVANIKTHIPRLVVLVSRSSRLILL